MEIAGRLATAVANRLTNVPEREALIDALMVDFSEIVQTTRNSVENAKQIGYERIVSEEPRP